MREIQKFLSVSVLNRLELKVFYVIELDERPLNDGLGSFWEKL
jgi:hypothetical protein